MPSPASGSYLGNLTAQRQKLSAIRQRLSLEPSTSGAGMRQLAPSPANGPAPVRGHAQAAVETEPDFDFDNYQLAPEKEQLMLDRIQGWIDENGNGIDDRVEGKSSQGGDVGKSPQSQVISDERVTRALGPLATFFQQNNRMPTAEEMQRVAARGAVKQQLGRDPSDDELTLYMTQPAKNLGLKPQRGA